MTSIREKLAIAHSTGLNRDIVLVAGLASPLGILILRWLDNGDRHALGRVKGALMREVVSVTQSTVTDALKIIQRVLQALSDQRCKTCLGRMTVPNSDGVQEVCPSPDCRDGLHLHQSADSNQHKTKMIILREMRKTLKEMDRRLEIA